MVFQVLTYLVTPGQRELPTPVVHLTEVHGGTLSTDGRGNGLHDVHQHLAVPLTVVVERNIQLAVQEHGVETDVHLVRLVPMYIAVHSRVVLVDGDAVARLIAESFTEHGAAVGILGVDLHPLPGGGVVAAGQTEGGAELEEVHELHLLLEPVLFRYHPTGTGGGEGAPVVLGGEFRGGVGAEKQLKKVFVQIAVVQAANVGECSRLAAGEGAGNLTGG